MARGKRRASPTWVDKAPLPTSSHGHPFFARLNRVLEEASSDACSSVCFRLVLRSGIAWRVADSLSLRRLRDLDVTAAASDHSTWSRTRRLIDVETHMAVFTWGLERLTDAGLVRGKRIGVDPTMLEANIAMRFIDRRDAAESYEAFVRRLAEASKIKAVSRAELARFDRYRKDLKTSNKEWHSPQDPDAKIAKMKDGRPHPAHKTAHGLGLETRKPSSRCPCRMCRRATRRHYRRRWAVAAEQVKAVQPDGPAGEEVVADKGYHSDKTPVALVFAVTCPSRSGVIAAGRIRRPARLRRRSVQCRGRRTGTAVVFAESGAVAGNGGVASWWRALSRASAPRCQYGTGVCVRCACAAIRLCVDEYSSKRRPVASGYCYVA